jgi:hypothetical protein
MYGQSRVNFNNLISGNTITVGADNMGAAGGAAGAYVGANYSIQLLWAAGTYADLGLFFAANPQSSTPVAFFGATGGGPTTDGAGLFDGGTVAFGGAAGTYTALARAWYNNGQYSTYSAATGANANAGQSALFSINATASPTPAPNTTFGSFTVGAIIPEPSTFVLAGLGIASLLLFRRRK